MADWDFVAPEDEDQPPTTSTGTVQFRPNRMALGCSEEIIQEQISQNAKKARLTKLLKRRLEDVDGLKSTFQLNDGSGSEANESRSAVRKITTSVVVTSHVDEPIQLTANQKKRHKRKLKEQQKKLLDS